MAFQAVAAAVGTAYSIYSGEKARKANKRAATQARTDAEAAARSADQAYNRQNQKQPNIAALLQKNQAMGSKGYGGTFLTGTGGAAPSSGMLGRSTLLGR